MKRCSEFAYSICPDRFLCGNRENAVFMEGSECDEFNEAQDAVAFRVGEIAASCAEYAAKTLSGLVKETLDRIELGLEVHDAED